MPPLVGELELGQLLVAGGFLSTIELDALLKQETSDGMILLLGEVMITEELITEKQFDQVLAQQVRLHVVEALRTFADKLIQQKLLDESSRDRALASFAQRPPAIELGTKAFLDILVAAGKLRAELRNGLTDKLEHLAQIHVQITVYGPDLDVALEEGVKLLRMAYQHRLIRADQVLKVLLIHIAQPTRPLREIAASVKLLSQDQLVALDRAVASGIPGIAGAAPASELASARAALAVEVPDATPAPPPLDPVESLGLGMSTFEPLATAADEPLAPLEYEEATEVRRASQANDDDDEMISAPDAAPVDESSSIPLANETFVEDLPDLDDDSFTPQADDAGSGTLYDNKRVRGSTNLRRPSREGTGVRSAGSSTSRRTAAASGVHRAAASGSRRRQASDGTPPPWPLILGVGGLALALIIAIVLLNRGGDPPLVPVPKNDPPRIGPGSGSGTSGSTGSGSVTPSRPRPREILEEAARAIDKALAANNVDAARAALERAKKTLEAGGGPRDAWEEGYDAVEVKVDQYVNAGVDRLVKEFEAALAARQFDVATKHIASVKKLAPNDSRDTAKDMERRLREAEAVKGSDEDGPGSE